MYLVPPYGICSRMCSQQPGVVGYSHEEEFTVTDWSRVYSARGSRCLKGFTCPALTSAASYVQVASVYVKMNETQKATTVLALVIQRWRVRSVVHPHEVLLLTACGRIKHVLGSLGLVLICSCIFAHLYLKTYRLLGTAGRLRANNRYSST